LEEIYQNTKTGSQNITKNILIRHGRSDYNEQHHQDSLGKAILSDIGDQQSKKLAEQLTELTKDDTTKHLYISPLQRCLLTAMPYLTTVYNAQQIAAIQTAYADAQHIYQQLWTDKTIIAYLQDPNTKKTFEIGPNIYVDFRLAEHIIHEVQDQDFDCSLIRSIPMDQKLFPNAESLNQLQTRVSSFVNEVNQQHKSECVIIISHGESLNMIKYTFKNFDYITRSPEKYLHNTDVDIYNAEVRYRDNTRNKEVDLHKPYVDSYRFKKGDQEYHRIPEVMDCRFES
jgi:broad specificity phosphatase PhoE